MIALLILILLSSDQVNSQQCGQVCNGNQQCTKKCDEYSKNQNKHRVSTPHCGLSDLNDTKKVSYPWLASLQYKKNPQEQPTHRAHFCTGVILNEQFILSSAHCIPKEPGSYDVMIGSESISIQDKNAMLMEIETFSIPGLVHKQWIKRHEGYADSKNKGNNDVVLIKTAQKIPFKVDGNKFVINSICMPESNYKPIGVAHTMGWGGIGAERTSVTEVMSAANGILSNEQANTFIKEHRVYFGDEGGQKYFTYNMTFKDYDFVTMASRAPGLGKEDPTQYQGDSGAPVVKFIDGRAFTLGVNHAINKGDIPLNIWARVQYYSSWIEKTMRKTLWDLEAYKQFG